MIMGSAKGFGLLGQIVTALFVLSISANGYGRQLEKVRFSYFPAIHNIAVMTAAGLGFFKDEGLDIEMIAVASGALQPAQLIAGEVALTQIGLDSVVRLHREGKQAVQVYSLVRRMTLDLVVRKEILKQRGISADAPIEKKLAALRGMRIGYTLPTAPTDAYSRFYLMQAGLDPRHDAELVQIGGPPSLVAALKQGTIDAFMLSPPTPQIVELEGFGTVFIRGTRGEVSALDDYPSTGIVALSRWAKDNASTVGRFVRALNRAREIVISDRKRALEVMRKFFPGMKPEALGAGYEAIVPALSRDGSVREESVSRFLNLAFDTGMLKGSRPSSEEGVLWTNEFIRMAERL